MEHKLISVIIPVYNVAAYLPECMESILRQDHEDLEIILIDDGSTDGSSEIIKQMEKEDSSGRIKVLLPKEHGTAARARNHGISKSQGRYIIL